MDVISLNHVYEFKFLFPSKMIFYPLTLQIQSSLGFTFGQCSGWSKISCKIMLYFCSSGVLNFFSQHKGQILIRVLEKKLGNFTLYLNIPLLSWVSPPHPLPCKWKRQLGINSPDLEQIENMLFKAMHLWYFLYNMLPVLTNDSKTALLMPFQSFAVKLYCSIFQKKHW